MNILRKQPIAIAISQGIVKHIHDLLAAIKLFHHASINQNRQIRKADSGRPKSSSLT